MAGYRTEVEGNSRKRRCGRPRTEVAIAIHAALTWAATVVPLPPPHLRRRFHQDRHVTVSFLDRDRATSSPGTRIFCTASHIDCKVRGEGDQRHKFQPILKRRKILTGKNYPGGRRVRGDTVSSAGGKKYKPV